MVVSSHSSATFHTGGLPLLSPFPSCFSFCQFISAFLQKKREDKFVEIFTKKKREIKVEAKSPSFVAVNLYLFQLLHKAVSWALKGHAYADLNFRGCLTLVIDPQWVTFQVIGKPIVWESNTSYCTVVVIWLSYSVKRNLPLKYVWGRSKVLSSILFFSVLLIGCYFRGERNTWQRVSGNQSKHNMMRSSS